jgi:hypothetical protein
VWSNPHPYRDKPKEPAWRLESERPVPGGLQFFRIESDALRQDRLTQGIFLDQASDESGVRLRRGQLPHL